MVTQLQPDVRLPHGAEVIKRYIRVEEVAREYGLEVLKKLNILLRRQVLYTSLPIFI